MLLIITGPVGSRKSTIARNIQRITGCRLYDEFPLAIPPNLPEFNDALVIITTNFKRHLYPEWIEYYYYEEFQVVNPET